MLRFLRIHSIIKLDGLKETTNSSAKEKAHDTSEGQMEGFLDDGS